MGEDVPSNALMYCTTVLCTCVVLCNAVVSWYVKLMFTIHIL